MKIDCLTDEELVDYLDLLQALLEMRLWFWERWTIRYRLNRVYAAMAKRGLFFAGEDLEEDPDWIVIADDPFPLPRVIVNTVEEIDMGGLLPTGRRNRADREAKSKQKRTSARAQRAKMKAHNRRQKGMNSRHGKKAKQR